MYILKSKAYTPGVRHKKSLSKFLLCKNLKVFKLKKILFNRHKGWSCNSGKITVRHKGAGVKKRYKRAEYLRTIGLTICVCYNSFRNSFSCINFDLIKKVFFQTVSTENVFAGSIFETNSNALNRLSLGSRTKLKNIPFGMPIHSLGLWIIDTGIYIWGAGVSGRLLWTCKKNNWYVVSLSSGKNIAVSSNYYATIGRISNRKYRLTSVGKAGGSRIWGVRPCTRGVAMNPVDHPQGGKSNKGQTAVSPWGIITKCGFRLHKKKLALKNKKWVDLVGKDII